MVNSRAKGARGERELANILRNHGYTNARRGCQFAGGPDSPDVVGLPGYHIEAKWVERLNIRDAMAQSEKDAGETEVPLVVHKKNGKPWLVTMNLEDFLKLVGGDNGGDLEANS